MTTAARAPIPALASALALVLFAGAALPTAAPPATAAPLAVDPLAPAVPRPREEGGIVGLKLVELSGREGAVLTIGQAFRRGDWPQGSGLRATSGGRPIPLQADVKARWADGSVRHAVLSFAAPGGRAAEILLSRGPAEPPQPAQGAASLTGLLERGLDLTVELAPRGGAPVRLEAARMIRAALASGAKPWLDGPLAQEIRATETLANGLTVILDLRAQADGAARLSVGFSADRAPLGEGPQPPLDPVYGLRILLGGQTVHQAEAFAHRRFSRWRKVVWAGAAPEPGRAVIDYPYLIAAGAVPAYDPELVVSPRFFEEQARPFAEAQARGDFEPLGPGTISKAMPNTGGRADIGPVPYWILAHLRLQSAETRRMMLANAEAAGSIPWRLRDPATGEPPTLDAWPKLWFDGRATLAENGHGPLEANVEGWRLDNAHQPDPSYVPYLLTGDRVYLDDLKAQAAYALLRYNPRYRGDAEGNLRNEEVRGQAWANRAHANAAFILPDDDPGKASLARKLGQRFAWYARAYGEDDALGGPASHETSGWIQGANAEGLVSNWQQDYFLTTLAQAGRMGFSAEAAPVWRRIRPYFLNRFLRTDFNPRWSTVYQYRTRDDSGAPIPTWRQIAAANLMGEKPAFEADPQHQAGGHDKGWDYASQARSGYAAGVSAFFDPNLAEAYAWLAKETIPALLDPKNGNGAAQYPMWTLVPVFPDGSTLAMSRHASASGRGRAPESFQGDSENRLFIGGEAGDRIRGGPGNEILVGWDGDDEISGGGGYNLIAGGRGDDSIRIDGGVNAVSLGLGADRLWLGHDGVWGFTVVWDFDPSHDLLILTAQGAAILRQALRDGPEGARADLGEHQGVIFRGRPAAEILRAIRIQ
ncbi:hypothetical protein [Neomegalonema sp.]|uniref:calcium-binding protein n=1 Tax=Neomegalonema sp. TaxID=2039713 RepID=UPI002620A6EA|nr:hypothetical protein [Neomegalonema sp.]MDD2868757.1 hypothetical protein [Neomegalonema sp.]